MNKTITLIDQWGNETTLENMGNMSRTKHSRVLSVLEKRAMRYREKTAYGVNDKLSSDRFDNIDETGTVNTSSLTDSDGSDLETEAEPQSARLKELLEAKEVEEVLNCNN